MSSEDTLLFALLGALLWMLLSNDKLEARLQESKAAIKRLTSEAAAFARNTAYERYQLEARLQKTVAERDDMQRLTSETLEFVANIARERDQLRMRLQETGAERDDLRRRVRHLANQVTHLENEAAEPGSHAAGLELLGLQPGCTDETARAAYRRVSRTVHPDVCKGPEASRLMHLATECYERIVKASGN